MEPEERRAIEWECTRLINLYANLNDQGRWEEVAALYTHGGSMTRPTAPDAPVVGREALLASFLARPPRTSQHVCANIVIDVESNTSAMGYSVILLFTAKDSPPLAGHYADRFEKTAEGWRFAERRGGLSFA
ncbi:nuclear transport factor 2 family protein [Sphingomonas canadensis]|uniref:Nuclear transport factor 2 family protein n=1 Tax=Sphingomonas canadensis TaxID=1219257 RepID=A0ABW3HAY6_9SPHN|nr:nuclear transport factor 2 family protein [Sphingomonas canadensis]MCW3837562.1 nuclear transport factor 2 family protein [Sphingomonas canadensis]